jgi:anaerobic selenocysteine-containing dehydrogenase
MKQVDPSFTTVHKTLCPFCSYGCEFGIVFDDFGVKGVEYLKDGSSHGRLCPRGSAAAMYLNHSQRLGMPVKNGKEIKWTQVIKDLKKAVDKQKNTAITFDRNITEEEYGSIVSFCKKNSIPYYASSYMEPDALLHRFADTPCTLDEIEHADVIMVIGDPFNFSPMVSKSIINWRLRTRKNRLVVIDSINTHTAQFATDFMRVKVGAEPLLLYALCDDLPDSIDLQEAAGVDRTRVADIRAIFKNADKGVIVTTLSFGHTYDPVLLVAGIGKFAETAQARVIPFFEHFGYEGNVHFSEIINLVKKRKIKHVINFGELFPFYYPQIAREMKSATIYSTSPLKFNEHIVLPAAMNLEKEGTIRTTFGSGRLSGAISPASGARSITEILAAISEKTSTGTATAIAPAFKLDVHERLTRLARPKKSSSAKKKKGKRLTLISSKTAYSWCGLLEDERVRINTQDAMETGVKSGDVVQIQSKNGSCDLPVLITEDVGPGILSVSAETPVVRNLFEYTVEDGVNFIPTEVEIWRKG